MTQNESRFAILQAVLNEFGDPDSACDLPEAADDAGFGDIPRFVMVERDDDGDTWYDFGVSAEELCKGAASDDSDYLPWLIVDLDTGQSRLVHVSYRVADTVDRTYAPQVNA